MGKLGRDINFLLNISSEPFIGPRFFYSVGILCQPTSRFNPSYSNSGRKGFISKRGVPSTTSTPSIFNIFSSTSINFTIKSPIAFGFLGVLVENRPLYSSSKKGFTNKKNPRNVEVGKVGFRVKIPLDPSKHRYSFGLLR